MGAVVVLPGRRAGLILVLGLDVGLAACLPWLWLAERNQTTVSGPLGVGEWSGSA